MNEFIPIDVQYHNFFSTVINDERTNEVLRVLNLKEPVAGYINIALRQQIANKIKS